MTVPGAVWLRTPLLWNEPKLSAAWPRYRLIQAPSRPYRNLKDGDVTMKKSILVPAAVATALFAAMVVAAPMQGSSGHAAVVSLDRAEAHRLAQAD
jgi:hypothetical protein